MNLGAKFYKKVTSYQKFLNLKPFHKKNGTGYCNKKFFLSIVSLII